MLAALSLELPAIAAHAETLADDELGSALPALALASARHETQYTRLFRS
jgi:urease accessory protein